MAVSVGGNVPNYSFAVVYSVPSHVRNVHPERYGNIKLNHGCLRNVPI